MRVPNRLGPLLTVLGPLGLPVVAMVALIVVLLAFASLALSCVFASHVRLIHPNPVITTKKISSESGDPEAEIFDVKLISFIEQFCFLPNK